jgi:hypothetical protein
MKPKLADSPEVAILKKRIAELEAAQTESGKIKKKE